MSESMVDFSAGSTQQAAPQEGQGEEPQQAAPQEGQGGGRVFEYKGEKIAVPENFWDGEANAPNIGALLKSQADLRRQVSERPKAPESYELRLPKDLEGKVQVNPEDPRWTGVTGWAKKHGLSQEALDELAAVEFQATAAGAEEDARYQAAEETALAEALGPRGDAVKKQIGAFYGSLLRKPLAENPALGQELQFLASSANGVLALKAIMEAVAPGGVPSSRDTGGGAEILSEDSLRRLQASKDYLAGDPAMVKRVQDGYRRLYGD